MTRDEHIARISQVLSDPRRVEILDLLAAGRQTDCCSPRNPEAPQALCACDLRPALGDMAPSKLAYHLKQLREAGLVLEQQRGKWVYYTLDCAALAEYARAVSERWGARTPPPSRRVTPPARAAGGGGGSASLSWEED